MELNTSGVLKSYPEMNPGVVILREMQERDIPVVVGSDAHEPARVGADFVEALRLLREIGYKSVVYFKGRKENQLEIDAVLASLAGRENPSEQRK